MSKKLFGEMRSQGHDVDSSGQMYQEQQQEQQYQEELKKEAKDLVNKVYQPMGYLQPQMSTNEMWAWASERVVDMIEAFILKMHEGSSIWLHHRKLIDEINKNK